MIDTAASFVLLAAREPDSASESALRSAAAAVNDWRRVGTLARLHNVAAIVSAAVARGDTVIPRSVARALREEELACVATTMVLDRQLERILKACAERSIEVIVLKGPALARTIYPDPALRPYADLDLVVRRETTERAVDVVRGLGFREVEGGAWSERAAISPFHRRFLDQGGRALVELHTDPLQLGLEPLDEDGRWSRAVPAPRLGPEPGSELGRTGYQLSDSDQLVHLSVHAHKHGFSRLIWLKDLDLMVRRAAQGISWPLVRTTAVREGVGASVWYALELAAELLGTPVPSAARSLAPAPPVRALYRRIWPSRGVAGLEATMHRRAVQFDAADSWRGMLPTIVLMGRRPERVRLLARHLGRGLTRRPT